MTKLGCHVATFDNTRSGDCRSSRQVTAGRRKQPGWPWVARDAHRAVEPTNGNIHYAAVDFEALSKTMAQCKETFLANGVAPVSRGRDWSLPATVMATRPPSGTRNEIPASESHAFDSVRGEAGRIFANALRQKDILQADKSYLTQLVAVRTGVRKADAAVRPLRHAERAPRNEFATCDPVSQAG
jgi:hypothetical protein